MTTLHEFLDQHGRVWVYDTAQQALYIQGSDEPMLEPCGLDDVRAFIDEQTGPIKQERTFALQGDA